MSGGYREGDWLRGESWDWAPVEARGVKLTLWVGSAEGILPGRGNKGPLFFLRRGKRKKVVVVDTVCVVVVVA